MSGLNEPSTVGIVTTTSNVRQLSDGNALFGGPGTGLGQSPADKLGFFGGTPVAQPGTAGGLTRLTSNIGIYGLAVTPVSVAANTVAEQSFTVTGVLATDMVLTVKPTDQAGLLVGTARVSAANTVYVSFGNVTGSPITPTASEVWAFLTVGSAFQTTQALTPVSVAANAVSEQFFTVPGLASGATVFVNKPTTQAGLMVVNARSAGPNQVAIQFFNATASPITPTAGEIYTFAIENGFNEAPVMTQLTQLLTPVSVAANTAAEQTFTVAGLIAGGKVTVVKPSVTIGLGIANARISAANTLAINFFNNTGSAIVPPAETYLINYFTTQAGNTTGTTTLLPASKGNDQAALRQLGLIA